MNRAEYLGAKLTMLIRRQAEQLAAWRDSEDKINALYVEIQQMDAGQLYAHTAELPLVSSPAEAVTEIRPLRADREDGGHTYNLAAVAETLNLPAPVSCPGPSAATAPCADQGAHMHYANGTVVRMKEWG